MLLKSPGKLENSRGQVKEFRVKNLADTLSIYIVKLPHLSLFYRYGEMEKKFCCQQFTMYNSNDNIRCSMLIKKILLLVL